MVINTVYFTFSYFLAFGTLVLPLQGGAHNAVDDTAQKSGQSNQKEIFYCKDKLSGCSENTNECNEGRTCQRADRAKQSDTAGCTERHFAKSEHRPGLGPGQNTDFGTPGVCSDGCQGCHVQKIKQIILGKIPCQW